MSVASRTDGPATGPPLVLSNSLGTTWEVWNGQLPELTERFRVVRYDHPGHGRSPEPEGSVTVETLARDVVELLDHLELERVTFCGLSLGGIVGMELARTSPDRIERLVLCCTAAYLGPPEGWHERARLVRDGGTTVIARRVLERWFTDRFRTDRADTVTRFREMLESITREGYARCCEAIATWDARERLAAIRSPTLVIAGADDVATPPADAGYLARSIAGAELRVLPGAAHLANVEQSAAFNGALLAFLAGERRPEEATA